MKTSVSTGPSSRSPWCLGLNVPSLLETSSEFGSFKMFFDLHVLKTLDPTIPTMQLDLDPSFDRP